MVAGETTSLLTVAALTVSVAVAVLLPEVAVITLEPAPTAVARPLVEMVATVTVAEVQVAVAVRSCALPSE